MINLEDLPDELLVKTLEKLPLKDFTTACTLDTRIRRICQDTYLLNFRLFRDFPVLAVLKEPNLTNGEWYLTLIEDLRILHTLSPRDKYIILLRIPLIYLIEFSKISSGVLSIINEEFWKDRIARDFPSAQFLELVTYEEFYKELLGDLAKLERIIFTINNRKTYTFGTNDIIKLLEEEDKVYLLKPGKLRYLDRSGEEFCNSFIIRSNGNIRYTHIVKPSGDFDFYDDVIDVYETTIINKKFRKFLNLILSLGYFLYKPPGQYPNSLFDKGIIIFPRRGTYLNKRVSYKQLRSVIKKDLQDDNKMESDKVLGNLGHLSELTNLVPW